MSSYAEYLSFGFVILVLAGAANAQEPTGMWPMRIGNTRRCFPTRRGRVRMNQRLFAMHSA
jgi:hypothetical protein